MNPAILGVRGPGFLNQVSTLPYRILIIYLVRPKKGTTTETIGRFRIQDTHAHINVYVAYIHYNITYITYIHTYIHTYIYTHV